RFFRAKRRKHDCRPDRKGRPGRLLPSPHSTSLAHLARRYNNQPVLHPSTSFITYIQVSAFPFSSAFFF
ncbi:MAG: hypothetical protein LBF50_09440, partial [Azoarcus sp.]|nr:hypothetical protein [Azoarcus sp.]